MLDEYARDQQERIERDISSFADPGTAVEVSHGGGRRFRATWTMRGTSREATFAISLDHGTSVAGGGRKQTYRAFLAGEQMANLRNVAEMIKQSSSRDIFVPTRARRTDQEQELRPATECLIDLVEEVEEVDAGATRVIMVTGEAGSGKTQVLQELVRRQADRYARGKTDKLFLYVNAQGRALARLNEALATELQDLRVNLTYHSVATLARVGILIPVIDGFDELLGVSGYDDAFNSLAQFLEQLNGQGCLVASARSVYYEEEFLSRAGRESATDGQAWVLVPVAIADWEARERDEFIEQFADQKGFSADDREAFQAKVDKVLSNQNALASKPLFVARTAALLVRGETACMDDGGDDDYALLLDAMTQDFLAREQGEKLLGRQQSPMLAIGELNLLMCELAQEMWNQETRELDSGSVREVADYALATLNVSESVRQMVTERMPTLAFLKRSDLHAGITFEHEVFFIYFLARSIVDQYLDQGADVRVMLSRSALPEMAAKALARRLKQRSMLRSPALQRVLDRLADAGRTEWRRTTQVRENAGLIVLAILGACKDHEIVGQTIASVVFPGGHLRDVTLRQCSLMSVSMRRTDLSRTRFIECSAEDTWLVEPRVKIGDTKLDLGLDVDQVVGIHKLGEDTNKTVYHPEKIKKILVDCGARIESENGRRDIPDERIEVLAELMRAYGRANPVCEEDDHLKHLFNDWSWSGVRRLLLKHGIITAEERQTGGKRKSFLRRRFRREEIMAGVNRNRHVHHRIGGFWGDLERENDQD